MKLRITLVVVALAAFIAIAAFNWNEVLQAFRLITTASWLVLLLVPLIQLMSFYSNAKYYQTFLENFNYRLPLKRLYKLSLALNFVNQISPSVGLTGVTFLSYGLKGSVPAGKSTLAQYGRYVLTSFSYIFLLALALFLLYFGGGINKITIRIVIILVLSTLGVGITILLAFSSRERFNSLVYWAQRAVDWVSGKLRRGKLLLGKERITRLLKEFHEGFDLVIKERRRLSEPFIYALIGNIMEVATLYVVFLALGTPVNLGAVIISYAVANATATISLVPGDVGVYELAMVAALTSTGVPVALGLSATLLYRVLNKVLFLPLGFYFYSRIINSKKARQQLEARSEP